MIPNAITAEHVLAISKSLPRPTDGRSSTLRRSHAGRGFGVGKDGRDGHGFFTVAAGGRGGVCGDIAHPGRAVRRHRPARDASSAVALAPGRDQRNMVGVRRGTVAAKFGIDARAAPPGMFELLKNENHRAFGEHETVPIGIVGTRGALRGVVAGRERARIWAKAPMESGVTTASAPPDTITSASPRWMRRADSPKAWPLVAQAVAMLMLGPRKSNWMASWPARMLGAVWMMKNGEILR